MNDERREGDDRPLKGNSDVHLTLLPAHDEPFRWLPRNGDPLCIGEWFTQAVIKSLAYLPIYIAIIVTLTLLVVIFGLPFLPED